MTLLELARQYKSDVETRIRCIEKEWGEIDEHIRDTENACNDYDDQIAHWNATLKQIQTTIKEVGENGILIVAAILNELEHGYGVKELESYGRPTCEEIAKLVFCTK